jgi:hypothetical protein
MFQLAWRCLKVVLKLCSTLAVLFLVWVVVAAVFLVPARPVNSWDQTMWFVLSALTLAGLIKWWTRRS